MVIRFLRRNKTAPYSFRLKPNSWRAWPLLCFITIFVALTSTTRRDANASAQSNQPSSQSNEIRQLQPNDSIQQNFSASERQVHDYEIDLVSGQQVLVTLACTQVVEALSIKAMNTAKEQALGFDSGLRGATWRVVGLNVPETGRYRIRVQIEASAATAGHYTLGTEMPTSSLSDLFVRARAQSLLKELEALYYQQRNKEAFLKMPAIGEEAAQLFGQLGLPKMQADALNLVGEAWRQLADFGKAVDAFERTRVLSQALALHTREAEVATFLGMCRYQLSDYRGALAAYGMAMAAHDRARWQGNDWANMQGWTMLQIGNAHLALGETVPARAAFEEAVGLYRSIYQGDSTGITGRREWHFGNAFALRGIGRIHALAGEKQQALDALSEALEHFKQTGDDYYAPLLLNEMGELYASLGDGDQARLLYGQALKAEQRMGSRATEAQTLYLMGRLHKAAGELVEAEKQFNQSLEIRRSVSDRRGEAVTLNALGEIAALRGEARAALVSFEQALAMQREIGDRYGEGVTLGNVGAAYVAVNDAARAAESLQQSLVLRRALGDREGEANGLYHLARLAYAQGQMGEARSYIEGALKQTELIRAGVFSLELRASYLGTVSDYYELYVEVLMRLHERRPDEGHAGAALQASEMARARSLLDSLTEAQADIRAGVASDLLTRERELSQRLQAKTEYHLRLQTGRHTAEQLAEAVKELQTITADYRAAQARIRAASPRYAALTQPQPLDLKGIQQQVLDDDTLLLEYALGEARSYLWVVSREGLHSFVLPGRAAIQAAARRVYADLIARNQFDARETAAQRRARIAQADHDFDAAASALSQMILNPAAALLGHKRLAIVAQDALQLIPFSVLPEPHDASVKAQPKMQPLLVNHEIVTLPSASMLAVGRREYAGRKAAPRTIAVLADPVFSAQDERVSAVIAAASVKTEPVRQRSLSRALTDLRIGQSGKTNAAIASLPLTRLTGTRWEAEQIGKLVRGEDQLRALDFAASRATAMSAELSQYRILHFATHALLNTVHPELSGIVLSLVNEQGRAQDGFLPAHEIYNLMLPADLVVLSACQTGLGKQVKGEGMIGLPQSFMYAGAPRVVVSLWAQPDKATADLMSRFYRRLLNEKSVTPVAALRAAQLEMWREQRWPAFYFWAGFTLQGEWR